LGSLPQALAFQHLMLQLQLPLQLMLSARTAPVQQALRRAAVIATGACLGMITCCTSSHPHAADSVGCWEQPCLGLRA
jgi:hypothetical protein